MGEPLWQELVKQVPSLAVLAWLVVYFLKHIKESGTAHLDRLSEIVDNCNTRHEDMHETNHATIQKASSALDKNTNALGRAEATMDRLASEKRRALQ